jgi:hypothetical protein
LSRVRDADPPVSGSVVPDPRAAPSVPAPRASAASDLPNVPPEKP